MENDAICEICFLFRWVVWKKKLQNFRKCAVMNPGSLAKLIDKADKMSADEIAEMGRRAKKRVAEEYTWANFCAGR